MNFFKHPQQMPHVAHLAPLHVSSADSQTLATLEPKLGQADSLVMHNGLLGVGHHTRHAPIDNGHFCKDRGQWRMALERAQALAPSVPNHLHME